MNNLIEPVTLCCLFTKFTCQGTTPDADEEGQVLKYGSLKEARFYLERLAEAVRANVTIDWTLQENVHAHLRIIVKRILLKYGYPPDKHEKATLTVLEQAELISGEWAEQRV